MKLDIIKADGDFEVQVRRGFGDLPGVGGSLTVGASRIVVARMGRDTRYVGIRATVARLRPVTYPTMGAEADAIMALVDSALA